MGRRTRGAQRAGLIAGLGGAPGAGLLAESGAVHRIPPARARRSEAAGWRIGRRRADGSRAHREQRLDRRGAARIGWSSPRWRRRAAGAAMAACRDAGVLGRIDGIKRAA